MNARGVHRLSPGLSTDPRKLAFGWSSVLSRPTPGKPVQFQETGDYSRVPKPVLAKITARMMMSSIRSRVRAKSGNRNASVALPFVVR